MNRKEIIEAIITPPTTGHSCLSTSGAYIMVQNGSQIGRIIGNTVTNAQTMQSDIAWNI